MKLNIGYPSREQEKTIVRRVAHADPSPIEAVATVEQISAAKRDVAAVHLEEKVLDYVVELGFATREPAAYGMEDLEDLIEFGTSPRATIFLARTSRARAYVRGRDFVMPDDVKAMAPLVLRHRLRTTYEADARGIDADEIMRRVLGAVPAP
jgi:MoxR-like ATPase